MRPPSYSLLENLKRIMRSIKFFAKLKRSLRTTACDSTMYWDCEKHGEPSSREVYLPARVWDALNPSERYASVADLCAHTGEQLPIQIVKLIARDILRELETIHASCGAHGGKHLFIYILFARSVTNFCRYKPKHHLTVSNGHEVTNISVLQWVPNILGALRIICWDPF